MCKVVLFIVAIIFPPLAVLFDQGCTCLFALNLLLTLLLFLPGMIHAIYIICCYNDPKKVSS